MVSKPRFKGYSEEQILALCHTVRQVQCTSLSLSNESYDNIDNSTGYLSIFRICSHSKNVSAKKGPKNKEKKQKQKKKKEGSQKQMGNIKLIPYLAIQLVSSWENRASNYFSNE